MNEQSGEISQQVRFEAGKMPVWLSGLSLFVILNGVSALRNSTTTASAQADSTDLVSWVEMVVNAVLTIILFAISFGYQLKSDRRIGNLEKRVKELEDRNAFENNLFVKHFVQCLEIKEHSIFANKEVNEHFEQVASQVYKAIIQRFKLTKYDVFEKHQIDEIWSYIAFPLRKALDESGHIIENPGKKWLWNSENRELLTSLVIEGVLKNLPVDFVKLYPFKGTSSIGRKLSFKAAASAVLLAQGHVGVASNLLPQNEVADSSAKNKQGKKHGNVARVAPSSKTQHRVSSEDSTRLSASNHLIISKQSRAKKRRSQASRQKQGGSRQVVNKP